MALPSIFATIYYKGMPVATGQNSYKTDPLQKKWANHPDKIYLHAEIEALKRASKILEPDDFRHTVMQIYRLTKSGDTTMARPCSGCEAAIRHFGLDWVLYTNWEGQWERLF